MSVRLDITAEVLKSLGYRALHAGDTYDMQFTAQRNGSAISLTGAKVWFTVKDDSLETDSQAKLQYDSDANGVSITDPDNGVFVVEFREPGTKDLEGEWQYDIQLLLSNGSIITQACGKIEFLPNLTRSTT